MSDGKSGTRRTVSTENVLPAGDCLQGNSTFSAEKVLHVGKEKGRIHGSLDVEGRGLLVEVENVKDPEEDGVSAVGSVLEVCIGVEEEG